MNFSASFVQVITILTVLMGCLTFVNCGTGGNECNCIFKSKEIQPFKLIDASEQLLKNDVERAFYNQKILNVTCSEEMAPCFKEIYTGHQGKPVCVTSFAYVQLYYRDLKTDKSEPQEARIGVGCSCKILNNDPNDYN